MRRQLEMENAKWEMENSHAIWRRRFHVINNLAIAMAAILSGVHNNERIKCIR